MSHPLPDPPRSSVGRPTTVPPLAPGLPPIAFLDDVQRVTANVDIPEELLAEVAG